jgi:hypothetical protein
LTGRRPAPYGATSIRQRHLKQLVRAAASLPGPKLDIAPWSRHLPLESVGRVTEPGDNGAQAPADARSEQAEILRLRALVADSLAALARRIDQTLPAALAQARQAWDKVDDLTIVDPPLRASLADARRWLAAAAAEASGARGAVALEGMLVLEAAAGLARLCERRLSALIRLRVRSQEDELLPAGRPFLDLGAALAEAARAWA